MKQNLFLAAFALLLLGCGAQEQRDSNQQVFRYNESKGIPNLDPAFARSLPVIWPAHQLFNGLVQLSDSLTVEPCIAKSWDVSANGLEYTFHLRTDVFFHRSPLFGDNQQRRVVATDFVYSFCRIVNPSVASPGAWVFASLYTDKTGTTGGCLALNDSTLRLYLKNPFPAFLGQLSMPYAYVVPKEVVEYYGRDFGRNPIGTGPFYVKYWKEGEKLVMRRNPLYFEIDESGEALPYLEAVSITFTADKQSEFLEFMVGNLDFLSGVHASSKDELLTRSGNLNPKYKGEVTLVTGPYLNTEYLGFLVDSLVCAAQQGQLLNPKLRKAIAYGFDRRKMMTYLRSNMGYPAESGFIPLGMPGFNPELKGFTYNPTLARQLLAEAGYPQGKGLLPITISTTDDYVDICEFIQHQLGQIGIPIRVEVMPGATYRDMMANAKLTFFRGSWVADYADAENYLALFASHNFSPNGPNYTHFSSKVFDSLYRSASLEARAQKRYPIYQQMDSMVIGNAVVIPLYYDKVVRFTRANVKGLKANPMNLLSLKRVRKQKGS
ncbi:MAG: ABC transporter substrate-binding protein [Bacteroidales bacterium]|nr:ABC transporter substrate-binding protein [Bacteroidales bacterium]MBN2750174.1 ABC transporter substrate-binding protein [Bacteroidales bacterium]